MTDDARPFGEMNVCVLFSITWGKQSSEEKNINYFFSTQCHLEFVYEFQLLLLFFYVCFKLFLIFSKLEKNSLHFFLFERAFVGIAAKWFMYRENMLECSAWYKRYALNGRRKEDIATLYLNISYVREKNT